MFTKLYMTLVLWDVLSIVSHTLLHVYVGPEHAWPVLAVVCGVCAVDRDLEMHEMVAAVYMLRFACRTAALEGSAAYLSCSLVIFVSLWAHTEAYLTMHYVFRRGVLYTAIVLAVMVRYPWNEDPLASVARLMAYTMLARRSVTGLSQDSWDVATQCIALFTAPLYALYALVIWPVAAAVHDWYGRPNASHRRRRTVWSANGIADDDMV